MMEALFTAEEVANWLRLDVVTVRRMIARGELGAYRIGNEFRCSLSDVQAYLEKRHIPARVESEEPDVSIPPEWSAEESEG
jgi:excisionase family DNA binding protein